MNDQKKVSGATVVYEDSSNKSSGRAGGKIRPGATTSLQTDTRSQLCVCR